MDFKFYSKNGKPIYFIMFLQISNSIKMDLGSAFAVFMVVALVLLLLFCLILKWYAYLMKKKRKLAAQRLNTTQQTQIQHLSSDYHGEYQEYCQRREEKIKPLDQKLLEDQFSFDYSLKRQITKISNDMYGLSSLRQRLNESLTSNDPFTVRHSMKIPLKQLSFNKINAIQTKKDSQSEHKWHEFVNRLICYQPSGLNLIQVTIQLVTKIDDSLIFKKKVQQTFIQADDPQLQNLIQSLGLQLYAFCYSKVFYKMDKNQLKNNSTYTLKSLQLREGKQTISYQEYLDLAKSLKQP